MDRRRFCLGGLAALAGALGIGKAAEAAGRSLRRAGDDEGEYSEEFLARIQEAEEDLRAQRSVPGWRLRDPFSGREDPYWNGTVSLPTVDNSLGEQNQVWNKAWQECQSFGATSSGDVPAALGGTTTGNFRGISIVETPGLEEGQWLITNRNLWVHCGGTDWVRRSLDSK